MTKGEPCGSVRHHSNYLRVSFLLAAISIGVCEATPPSQDIASKAEEYMQALTDLRQFSGAVLVAKAGKPIVSRGFGLADIEWNIPNDPITKFRIGSITKQFTAAAILLLQEDNKLNVHDSICEFVPDCPAHWKVITVHQVLTHTAGIPDYTDLPAFAKTEGLPATPVELVGRFKNMPLEFKPGEKFKYSNSNYVLLGFIIERLSGKTYQSYLQTKIFDPLGMHDSGYDSSTAIIPRRASGYSKANGHIVNADYIDMSVPFAAGALYSTVQDMMIWDQALYTTKLLPQKALQAMFTPYTSIIGYGWAIERQFGRKIIHHNGMVNGFVGNIARFPDDKVTIVVLSNLDAAPIDVLSKDLAAIVFGEKYDLPKEHVFIRLDASVLKQYVGRYQVEVAHDIVIVITQQPGGLSSEVQGQTFTLRPESKARFSSEDSSANVLFSFGSGGRIDGLTFNGQFKAKRMP